MQRAAVRLPFCQTPNKRRPGAAVCACANFLRARGRGSLGSATDRDERDRHVNNRLEGSRRRSNVSLRRRQRRYVLPACRGDAPPPPLRCRCETGKLMSQQPRFDRCAFVDSSVSVIRHFILFLSRSCRWPRSGDMIDFFFLLSSGASFGELWAPWGNREEFVIAASA